MKYFLLLMLLAFTSTYSETVLEEEKDGVKVLVDRATDSLKGFKAFSVRAENLTDKKKSVEIRIQMNDNTVKEPAGASGECTVFLKLDPNGSASEEKHCKEKKAANSWTALIYKVYNFHLK